MCLYIESPRLTLHPLAITVLESLLANDHNAVGRMLDCHIPPDLLITEFLLTMRRDQLLANASVQPWLLRAMIDRRSRTMVGHIGFHSPPRPPYLATVAADAVELGYTVHPTFRRRGFATEAALALMHWAFAEHGQRCFLLSISPQNLPSTAMAESLGFTKCGSHMDDEDGLEIEYLRRFENWPEDWRGKMGERIRHDGRQK